MHIKVQQIRKKVQCEAQVVTTGERAGMLDTKQRKVIVAWLGLGSFIIHFLKLKYPFSTELVKSL